MKELIELRAKAYSYLKENNDEDKKAEGAQKCVIKRKLKFEDCKTCLEATQIDNKRSYLEKNQIDLDRLNEFKKNL